MALISLCGCEGWSAPLLFTCNSQVFSRVGSFDNGDTTYMLHNPLCRVSTGKPVLSGHSKRIPNLVFKTDFRLMQVKLLQNAQREHSAILSTFIKLPFVDKTFVLYIFEWAF